MTDEIKRLLEDAAVLLNDVRTGGDFEVECWQHAEAIQEFLDKSEN